MFIMKKYKMDKNMFCIVLIAPVILSKLILMFSVSRFTASLLQAQSAAMQRDIKTDTVAAWCSQTEQMRF